MLAGGEKRWRIAREGIKPRSAARSIQPPPPLLPLYEDLTRLLWPTNFCSSFLCPRIILSFFFSFLFFLFAFFHFFPFPFFILGLSFCNLRSFNFSVILSCSFSREIFTATAKSVPAFYEECRLRVCTSFFFLVRRDWRVEGGKFKRRAPVVVAFYMRLAFLLIQRERFFFGFNTFIY